MSKEWGLPNGITLSEKAQRVALDTADFKLGSQRLARDLAFIITKHPDCTVAGAGVGRMTSVHWSANTNTVTLTFSEV